MIYLYNEHEGSKRLVWQTMMENKGIVEMVDQAALDSIGRCDGSHGWQCDIWYPPLLGKDFPLRLHSIVLSDGRRWDAFNRKWMSVFDPPFNESRESFDRRCYE